MTGECKFCHKFAGDILGICPACRGRLLMIGFMVFLFAALIANTDLG